MTTRAGKRIIYKGLVRHGGNKIGGNDLFRKIVQRERLAFKRHAAIRMRERNISAVEVEAALLVGEVVEDYSASQSLPSYLILGYTKAMRPIHIVAAVDTEEEMVWVITAYEPNHLEWKKGLKQRRKSQ